ncbi:MAG: Uma2 family endonuclease [Pyrinomonadaceae bacterium]|nr:Uma2 family endonuclease [Pyrinomonadaceae bacterium]
MSAVLDLPKTYTTSISTIKKATDFALKEQVSVILSDVTWETYNDFIQETMDKIVNPRFYFENGNLFIMPLLPKHERINYFLELLINILTEEFQIDCIGLGSTTYQRKDIEKGFEPDSCFYFKYEKQMRNKDKLDMAVDPAPELIIEVDITSLSTNRQSIFAAFGVPEIWRFNGEKMQILKLENGKYSEIEKSLALPKVTPVKLTEFVQKSETLSRLEWISEVRNWAKKA